MRRAVPFLALMTILAFMTGCESSTGSTDKIKIGAIHPLTGALAVDGLQMDRAARLAAERINASGGIASLGGAKLEIASSDSQSKPDVGQTEAQRLIDDGVVTLLGTFQSSVAANVANLSERTQIPFVIDLGVDDALINDQSRYTFRVGPNASGFGRSGAQDLVAMARMADTPIKTVAYMYEQTAFGTGVFNGFKAEAAKLGLTIVEEISYDAFGTKSFTTHMTRVAASGADVLATTGYFPDGVQIARDASSVKPNVEMYYGPSHGAYAQDGFVTADGPASELVFGTDYYWNVKNPRVAKVLASYRKKYDENMRTSAMMTYQSVEVVADALERAGKANPDLMSGSVSDFREPLRAALSNTSISDGLMAFPIVFDATGENPKSTPTVLQVQEGKAVPVWPRAYAKADPIIPGVPWGPAVNAASE